MADSFSDVMGYQTPLGANSMFADSPFGQDWDILKAEIYTASPEDNNTLYFTFLPYKDLEKLYSDFVSPTYLTSTNSSHILIAYSIDSDEELLIKIRKDPRIYSSLTSTSVFNYTNPTETVTFSQHLLSRIIQTAPTDFKFEKSNVEVALKYAIDDYKFSVDHKDVSQSSNYTTSATSLNQMADKNGKGVKSLLLQINKAIAKMSAEDKFVYNQWVQSKANPYNYFFPVRYKKDNLSSDDLRRFLNQLNNIRAAIDELQSGEANSLDKLMQLIALRLTAGGSEIKWLINTPFFNLSKAQRKKYLTMFAESDAAIYSQASISSGIGGGDVVLQLLATAKSQDLIDIILELENEGKLFLLLNNLKLNAFKDVALLISNAYMSYLLSNKDDYLYVAAIEKGHQLKFDNQTFGNANSENFDEKKKKITFKTDENVLLKLLKGAREDIEGIEADLPKIPVVECNPLDLILFTPVRDVKLEGIELAAGIPYKLPACLVYAIYRQESIDSAILGGLLVLQVAMCAVGIGELIAAIEAASAFGVVWTGTGLATDAAFATILIPEVQQDYPQYTKAVNYIIWARILMELGNIQRFENEVNSALVNRNKIIDTTPGLTNAELDWMASRSFDRLGGRVAKASQIRKLRGILKQKGITLFVEGDIKSVTKFFKPIGQTKTFDDFIMHMYSFFPPKVGGFHAPTKQFILSKNPSELIIFHEMAHAKQFEEVGEFAYSKLTQVQKEMYVWNQISKFRSKWSKAEFEDSLNYINDIRRNSNLEAITIK